MSPTPPPVWTTSRRLLGNLLPLLVVGPGLGFSLWEVVAHGIGPKSLAVLGLSALAGWLSVCLFGLVGNGAMKREMSLRLHKERPFDRHPRWFVGFARPRFKGLLDPHEDVGFLILEEERLLYWGECRKVELHRDQIVKVRFRPNIHTLIGLGGWISVEAVLNGAPARLLVEPRETSVLLANLLQSRKIRRAITQWARREPLEGGSPSNEAPTVEGRRTV